MRCVSSRPMPVEGSNSAAAHQPAVHHDAHAFDREAGLRDVRGEHDLARAGPHRRERGVLIRAGQIAEQRQAPRVRLRPSCARFEQRLDAADLARAGQEHEHVAALFAQRALHDLRTIGRSASARQVGSRRPFAHEPRLHRKHAALGRHDRRIAQQCLRPPRRPASRTSPAPSAPATGCRAHPAQARDRGRPAGCARETHRRSRPQRLRARGRSAASG